jgi:hypothetical protein
MALVGMFCVVLLVITTVIHYEVLRVLTAGLPALRIPARAKLMAVIFGTFFTHAAEIFLYAVGFYVLIHYLSAGTLGHASSTSLTLCLYFSAETYTSLGYGDVVPGGELRLLAGMEALNGLLLIGWSASYTYIAMERFWSDRVRESAPPPRPRAVADVGES